MQSKGLPPHSSKANHSSKASILQHSAFFIVLLSHSYMTTVKTIALTRWTFVAKVMSLLFNMLSRLVIAFHSFFYPLAFVSEVAHSNRILEAASWKRHWETRLAAQAAQWMLESVPRKWCPEKPQGTERKDGRKLEGITIFEKVDTAFEVSKLYIPYSMGSLLY